MVITDFLYKNAEKFAICKKISLYLRVKFNRVPKTQQCLTFDNRLIKRLFEDEHVTLSYYY